jgi:hypothetical protein
MPLINKRFNCLGKDQLEEVVREAIARLYVAIKQLGDIAEDLPPGDPTDLRNGYEVSCLEDVLTDIATGLQQALDEPEPAAAAEPQAVSR